MLMTLRLGVAALYLKLTKKIKYIILSQNSEYNDENGRLVRAKLDAKKKKSKCSIFTLDI